MDVPFVYECCVLVILVEFCVDLRSRPVTLSSVLSRKVDGLIGLESFGVV